MKTMKILSIALIAAAVSSQAFAQQAPQTASQQQNQPATDLPGANGASDVSQGVLDATYIGMGVVAVAVIAGATSSSNHGNEIGNNGSTGTTSTGTTGGTTGGTGTN